MKTKIVGIILILCLTKICSAQQPIESSSLNQFIDDYFKGYIGKSIAGASVVFVQGDAVILEKSLGYAKPEQKIPADPKQTVYQVGSNSKLFVVTAAMQLYEQGKLDLNADINKYLKDMNIKNDFPQPVTMARLLTHTSGVEDRTLGRNQSADGKLMTLGEFFQKYPPRVSVLPGDQLNYSGNAISLAAHVIEEISGEPFYQYVEEHIYAPLKMNHSSFRQPLPDDLLEARAAMPNLPLLIEYPQGGMASTVDDMSHFLIAHLNGGSFKGKSILNPETTSLMQTRHFSPHSEMSGIGYGFFETNINGYTIWMHTGDYQHISVLCLVPEKKFGFFLVMNLQEELHEPVLTNFVGALFNNFFPAQTNTDATRQKTFGNDIARFAGYYRDNSIPKSTIEKFIVGMFFAESNARVIYDDKNNRLIFQPPGAEDKRFQLTQIDDLLFKGGDENLSITVNFRKNNEATNMFISAGALGQYSFEKISWTTSQVPQFLFHLIVLFLFGVWLIVVFVKIIIQYFKRRKGVLVENTLLEKAAFLNLSIVAVLADLGFFLFAVLGFTTISSVAMITGVPALFKILPLFYTAACVAALPLTYFLFMAWKQSFWKLPLRIFFSLITLVAILFIPFCVYWNLFGLNI